MSTQDDFYYTVRFSFHRDRGGILPPAERERLSDTLWAELTDENGFGLLGIHEGTMLSEEAFERGLETESFTLDAALAPRERDWVKESNADWILYFSDETSARRGIELLKRTGLGTASDPLKEIPEDWDAQWKASFMGIDIEPHWVIRPPWNRFVGELGSMRELVLNPGAGFGTGNHETTRLCLEEITPSLVQGPNFRVLDFGSGSGVLAIGAALLGAQTIGVEIDPLANDNAIENARLNGLTGATLPKFQEELTPESDPPYDLVIANILRPVLMEFAPALVSRLKPGGTLLLSGLVEEDVSHILGRYEPLLGQPVQTIRKLNDWRALVFKKRA